MKTPTHSKQRLLRRSVSGLKRDAYVVALLLASGSMLTELWFGSPTHELTTAVIAFDRVAFPLFIILAPLIFRFVSRPGKRTMVAGVERAMAVSFMLFFVSKFGLVLLTHPTVPDLAYVESWYWMLFAVWALLFMAYNFRAALWQAVVVYAIAFTLHVTSVSLKAAPGAFTAHMPDLIASHLRLSAALTLLVVLGRIKHQWVVVEEEASAWRDIAHIDALTELPNRRHLNEVLSHVVSRSYRVTVIMFDLDAFKKVNDRFGHAIGDEVLGRIGTAMQQCVRGDDTVGRWGGEEFLVICPDTSLEEGLQMAERLRTAIGELELGPVGQITASFGVAERIADEAPDQLMGRVDQALYEAKEQGKNTVKSARMTA